MPIDVDLIREYKGGDPAKVRASETKRRNKPEHVEDAVRLDREWVAVLHKYELCSKEKNKIDEQVKASKDKRPTEEQRKRSKELTLEREALKEETKKAEEKLKEAISKIGNLLHPTVPDYAKEEDFEDCVTSWGEFKVPEGGVVPHYQALWMIGGYEPERGSATAGHRGYYLRGPGVLLNQALISYSIQFLIKRGFEPVQPPYFMTKSCMAKVSQLSDFEESLYHVGEMSRAGAVVDRHGEKTAQEVDDGYFLIATSEQPMCCFHQNENMTDSQFPIKYAGFSPCFRKEAGKFGVDTLGIFRVHQFDKVEQFVVSEPNEEVSYKILEELRGNAEDFLKSLKLPFKTINVVAGELNLAAAKKYDINAWFPSLSNHRELVSASNCTDYQSRATDTYIQVANRREDGSQEGRPRQPVHLLNATLCALTRTICCILENHQGTREIDGPEEEKIVQKGVHVPEVLLPYMGGVTFLPFIREPREMANQQPTKSNKTEARKKGEAVQKSTKEKQEKSVVVSEAVSASPAPVSEVKSGASPVSEVKSGASPVSEVKSGASPVSEVKSGASPVFATPAAAPAPAPAPAPAVPFPAKKRESFSYKVAGESFDTSISVLADQVFDSVQTYVAFLNKKA